MKTLAHEILEIEGENFPISTDSIDELERILEKGRKIDCGPRQILAGISNLLNEEGFEYEDNRLLSRGLKERRTFCFGYSALYYSIGETLGIPIQMVSVPLHVFVQLDGINWETTADREVTKEELDNMSRHYVYNLSRSQMLGIAYDNRGGEKLIRKEFSLAINDFDKSLELFPESDTAYSNRGTAKTSMKDYYGAIRDFQKALEILQYSKFYVGLARAKIRIYDNNGAIYACDLAIAHDPNLAEAYEQRGNAKFNKGEFEKAIRDYDKAIGLDPKLISAYGGRCSAKFRIGDKEGMEKDWAVYASMTFG